MKNHPDETSPAYQKLNPNGHININKEVKEVWEKLTKPGEKYTWMSDDSYLISSWKNGEPIKSQDDNNHEYYRGVISKVSNQKSISFTIHNAFEEDHLEPGEQPDWNDETWELSFEADKDKTKLTMEMLDYDSDHDDEEHDHEDTINSSKEVEKNIIPKMLKKIKAYCEQK